MYMYVCMYVYIYIYITKLEQDVTKIKIVCVCGYVCEHDHFALWMFSALLEVCHFISMCVLRFF